MQSVYHPRDKNESIATRTIFNGFCFLGFWLSLSGGITVVLDRAVKTRHPGGGVSFLVMVCGKKRIIQIVR